MMAVRTKTPIVPIVITKRPKYFRLTHILVGEAIELSEYYDKKLTENDYNELEEKLRLLMINMREEFFKKQK